MSLFLYSHVQSVCKRFVPGVSFYKINAKCPDELFIFYIVSSDRSSYSDSVLLEIYDIYDSVCLLLVSFCRSVPP